MELDRAKAIRKQCFLTDYSYDTELAAIVDVPAPSDTKKKIENHDFLKKPLWQNMHIYLVEYLITLSREWFGNNTFKVLDWGSGKCQVTYLCKKRGVNIVACDVEGERGDSAFGQYTPIADFAHIDVVPLKHTYVLPFENSSFDVVLSFGVLEHVPDDIASLTEITRILKPNGLFFCFFLPYKYSWKQNRDHLQGKWYHDHLYDIKIVKDLLSTSGLSLLEYWYRDLFPKRYAPSFYRAYERLDNWFCRHTLLKHLASNIEFVAYKAGENIAKV